MSEDETRGKDELRATRRSPTPAQTEPPRKEGALSPAALWGNPRAAPDGVHEGDVEEALARARPPRRELPR